MNILIKEIVVLLRKYDIFKNINEENLIFVGISNLVYDKQYLMLIEGLKSSKNIFEVKNVIAKYQTGDDNDNILYYKISLNNEKYLVLIEDKFDLFENLKILAFFELHDATKTKWDDGN